MIFFLILGICLTPSLVESKVKLDELVPVCNINDVNVEDCIRSSANKIMPILAKGIRDWNVLGLDPIFIPSILIGQESGPISLRWEHTNTTIRGYGHCNITKVTFNKLNDNYDFIFNISLRNYTMIGGYKARGKILFFPMKNEGRQEIHSGPSTLDLVFNTKVEKRNDVEHLKVEKFKLFFTFSKQIRVVLKGKSKRPNELDKIMSRFLNENTQEILGEMKHTFEEVFGKLIHTYVQLFFNAVPLRELFKQ